MECLYCEKLFPDYPTLKDHMRKKQHKRINGRNHAYDQFYPISYLQPGQSWEEVQAEDDRELVPRAQERCVACMWEGRGGASPVRRCVCPAHPLLGGVSAPACRCPDSEWSDWQESTQPLLHCLFCAHCSQDLPSLLQHMSTRHAFHYQQVCHALQLDYHAQVKLVNFIRRQVGVAVRKLVFTLLRF